MAYAAANGCLLLAASTKVMAARSIQRLVCSNVLLQQRVRMRWTSASDGSCNSTSLPRFKQASQGQERRLPLQTWPSIQPLSGEVGSPKERLEGRRGNKSGCRICASSNGCVNSSRRDWRAGDYEDENAKEVYPRKPEADTDMGGN